MLVKWHIYRFTHKTEGGRWGACHLLLFGKLKQSLPACNSSCLNLHVNLFDLSLCPCTYAGPKGPLLGWRGRHLSNSASSSYFERAEI